MEEQVKQPRPCIFFLPVYSPGHLIPMVEFTKRLLQCNSGSSMSITFLLMYPPNRAATSAISTSYLQSTQALGLPIRFHQLPSVDPPVVFDGPEEFNLCTQLHLPHIKAAISASSSRVSALVLDLFSTAAIDVAKELNIPSYIYFSSTLTFLTMMLHLPKLPPQTELDFWETKQNLCIPGIAPVPALSMPKPLMSSKLSSFRWFVHHARRYTETEGIIVNSNSDIEPKALAALADGKPEIFPVGPIISFGESASTEHGCLMWLDKQPAKSVVFLCFGSRGAFEPPQVDEMAAALERSGCRFLWVLRAPGQGMKFPTDANLEELLPEGYLERTKERGLVWPSRVPQTEILAHPAVGGFVTHCGWNSILESLWFGVPMIPWPLYAEQHLNAFEMVSEMGVAVDMKVDRKKDNFVDGDDLEQAVRCLMEEGSEVGRRVRANAERINALCRKAVERGGSSYLNLQHVAENMLN
ncbi:Glycosyltransferase [Rhynchospora pubera]|uniref:Glycosyltransferase n=1 Tax=Rhynchospora pubera TaxID=906938 RepID=A0AAV8EW38_9POAL|nr:Glycosyltransferase [Rhynchospora pubera]